MAGMTSTGVISFWAAYLDIIDVVKLHAVLRIIRKLSLEPSSAYNITIDDLELISKPLFVLYLAIVTGSNALYTSTSHFVSFALKAFSAQVFSDFPYELKHSAEGTSQSCGSSHSTESSESLPQNLHRKESSNITSRLRRGRPQQDISDDDNPSSQKRRHRRLYARQYRAQMRHKVDEVKVLKAKLDEMRRTIEMLEITLATERREHQQNIILLNSMIQSKLIR